MFLNDQVSKVSEIRTGDNLFFSQYINRVYRALEETIVTSMDLLKIGTEDGFKQWCDMTRFVHRQENTIFLVGNGASASMASHMAADMVKSCRVRAMAFNDSSLLTAVSNDISYEKSFSTPLDIYGKEGDLLITISSSGNSPNIIDAIKAARLLKMDVITISAMNENNGSRRAGDLNFYVPENEYGLVESCHQTILHCWLDMYIETYMKQKN